MKSLNHFLYNSSRHSRRSAFPRARPLLENLEDRLVPANES